MAKIKLTTLILALFLLLIYWTPRLYQFPQRLALRYDQGLHLLESWEMVQSGKLRLIGPMVTSKAFDGRHFFIGPQYYYLLALVGTVVRWNPLQITFVCDLIDFLVIVFFCLWLKKMHGSFSALLIYLFVALSPYLIMHNLFVWNPHWLLPLTLLMCPLLYSHFHHPSLFKVSLIAFLWGLAFSFHFAALLITPILLVVFLRSKSFRWYYLFVVVFFFLLGDLPFFLFELRHQFYNLTTMVFIATHSHDTSGLSPHYFIYPFLAFCLFAYSYLLRKKPYLLVILIPLTIVQFTLSADLRPLDVITGWDYPQQQHVAALISQNCPPQFQYCHYPSRRYS